MAAMENSAGKPGWYYDPQDPSRQTLRMWNGTVWTSQTRPAPTQASTPAEPADEDASFTFEMPPEHGKLIVRLVSGVINRWLLFTGLAFTVAGFGFFLVSAGPSITDGVATTAVVRAVAEENLAMSDDEPESIACTLTFAYTAEDGQIYRHTNNFGSGAQCDYVVGDSVNIVYERADPATVRMVLSAGDQVARWFSLVFGVLGLGLLGLGVWARVKMRRMLT